jgi:hypothetical protein
MLKGLLIPFEGLCYLLPIVIFVERVRLGDQHRFERLGIAGAIATPFDVINLGQHLQHILN